MTLTVDLTSEEVARLSAEAAERGLDISEYARRLLIERLTSPKQNGDQAVREVPFYLSATPEAWKSGLQAWSQSHSKSTPLISDEMLRRENLYEDR
jgi:hypothetical protein